MSLRVEVDELALGGTALVRSLRIEVPPGVAHTVMGPSGCGKSSLLAAVSGTLDSAFTFRGRIVLDGEPVGQLPPQRRRIGILFQDDLLFPHMTVRENLLFAVPPGARAQREAAVAAALRELELQGFGDADPATLSGGQRGRVALMRAILAEPHALLLDEPFARLDAPLRARMRQFVFGLLRERRIPALLVTHDAADVADADHLTRLGPDPGPAASPAGP
ncbi:MAG: ATP-binding cassette domain-containing protein [Pseudomonadota bacterium]